MEDHENVVALDMIPATTPRDEIECEGEQFTGIGYYYVLKDGDLKLRFIQFDRRLTEVLPPFKYKKPMIADGDVLHPDERWEDKERVNYHILAIVHNAYRGPNHWHREDDALFCAVWVEDRWVTKYFPRGNIEPEVWRAAEKILGVGEPDEKPERVL
jgi:hypothetical protein